MSFDPRAAQANGVSLRALICLAVLCTILSLGLWPFHAPKNDVRWLRGRGLEFGRFGTAISSKPLQLRNSEKDCGASVEIWMQPGHIWNFSSFLGFSVPENRRQLLLRESQNDLEIEVTENREFRAVN
jgi:hypothetical protein